MSISGTSSPDLVQLLMLKKQLSAEAGKSAQLLEGLKTPPAAAPPARPAPAPGTSYL